MAVWVPGTWEKFPPLVWLRASIPSTPFPGGGCYLCSPPCQSVPCASVGCCLGCQVLGINPSRAFYLSCFRFWGGSPCKERSVSFVLSGFQPEEKGFALPLRLFSLLYISPSGYVYKNKKGEKILDEKIFLPSRDETNKIQITYYDTSLFLLIHRRFKIV